MSDDIKFGVRSASGRFLLRLEPGVHAALRAAAAGAGVSLNEYCARKLASPWVDPFSAAVPGVERAMEVMGQTLVGVVAFGSWARGDWVVESDVDVLIVVDAGTSVVRDLYRRWDERPVRWEGHAVEPHFARLPDPGRPTGLWSEVAVEGVVLYDRAMIVTRRLVELRREILEGRMVRRRVQGQPYWVERVG
jgi:predicted nucleotidyltransferase